MIVPCQCCVLSRRGLCVGPITRAEESYPVRCVCNREASVMRRLWSTRVCSAMEKEMKLCGLKLDLTQTDRCYILSVYLSIEIKSSFIAK